jgi:hypothetical protein
VKSINDLPKPQITIPVVSLVHKQIQQRFLHTSLTGWQLTGWAQLGTLITPSEYNISNLVINL